uniref:Uncharacterized protein n=1 Tax=uncultured marine group II/III euryarchaeote KM3_87_B04 TaxID=1456530 RepID=A0A075I0L0_9EURY|nr:hypothetical protein [uncultured marine group II/III euryarchaeote KM3_87_B04]
MPTNRFYCNVLHECRVALGKLSIFNLWFFKKQFAMLLEELQGHGNRMEAALEDKRDLHRYHDEAKKVHVELKALRMEKEELDADIAEMQLLVNKDEQVDYLHKKKIHLTREVKKLQKKKDELLDIDEDLMDLGELW